MRELSLVELESELSAELPTRNLMRRRRCGCRSYGHSNYGGNGGSGANASYGSAANSNMTTQQNINPQTVVNTGNVAGGIRVSSFNRNTNTSSQTATPINFGVGL